MTRYAAVAAALVLVLCLIGLAAAQPPAPPAVIFGQYYFLTVTKAGSGAGTVASDVAGVNCGAACLAPYAPNTSVTLTAAPSSGSTFTGWSGSCSGTSTCVVAMINARNVTATFTSTTNSITLAWTDNSSSPNETADEIYQCVGDRCTPSSGSLLTTTAANATSYSYIEASTGIRGYAVRAIGPPASPTAFSSPPVYASFHNGACPCTIWPSSSIPTAISANDGQPVSTGTRFRADATGYIKGVRFYKGPTNTGTHTGSLYTNAGTLLASVVFTGETSSGWQQMLFATPVAVTAGTTYVASLYSDAGYYNQDGSYFTSQFYGPPVRALIDGTDGFNGPYIYGAGFPNLSAGAANYWVDVVFDTVLAGPAPGITLGTTELVYTDAATPIGMWDGPFATLKRDATTFYAWHTIGTETTKWIGTPADPFQTLVWLKTQAQLWNMRGIPGRPWLYGVYETSPGGPLLGWIHIEFGAGPNAFGIGYSTDGGEHWTYVGDVVRPQYASGLTMGQPVMTVGPYFYAYMNEFPQPGPPIVPQHTMVARALIADVVSGAANLQTTPWKKYSNGTWTEDGLTGLGSNIIPEAALPDGWGFQIASDGAYSTALGKYILLADDLLTSRLWLYTSTDGVTWGNPLLVDQAPNVGNDTVMFATIVDLSAGVSNDMHTVGGDFWIIWPRKRWKTDYTYDETYRRRVTIQ